MRMRDGKTDPIAEAGRGGLEETFFALEKEAETFGEEVSGINVPC